MPTDQQRIYQLLTNSTWSPEDEQWMVNYIQQNDYTDWKESLQELLEQDELQSNKVSKEISERIKQQLQARITEATHKPITTHRIHFLKTSWFRYAAAIILMLGVGSYVWFNHTTSIPANPKNPINHGSDIAAGGNKATLTLADGSTIILDSAQGNIVQQGNLKVINVVGKLDYEGVGTRNEIHTLSTPKGGQYQLVLPDGSKVWLNAASSITYPTAFAEKDRTVTITGEAYFEVANDKSKIFHVKTPKEEITVLGTHFNVNAYSNETAMKASLLEGAIKIDKFILQPGQAYINGKVIATDVDQDVAWKNGFFNLQNADFEEVMRQLERWYDIQVKYESTIPKIKFKGEINRGVNLSDVLKFLRDSDIQLKLEGKILIVK